MTVPKFLPGVPSDYVLARLAKAGSREVESGKFASPQSSTALAINCFGWFIERPERLPPLNGLERVGAPELVDVEFCARFPWAGGSHPWLDAVVQTPTTLIGIESKRLEPFRGSKPVRLSDAYDRSVWGDNMRSYERMRDRLRSGEERFVHLDAAQLVKHAFGLVTEGKRRQRAPVLFYLFAEPEATNARPLTPEELARRRLEIARFNETVAGDEVAFRSASYREWLSTWPAIDGEATAHRVAIVDTFAP